MPILISSYPESNQNTNYAAGSGNRKEVAQSFTNVDECILDSCKFNLSKQSSPTGNIYAKLYTEKHATAYGVDSLPDTLLATSDAVDVSTLAASPSFALQTFTFSGSARVTLSANTYYVISVAYDGDGNNVHLADVGIDTSSPTASGNLSEIISSWTARAYDTCFYVYGTPFQNAAKDENSTSSLIGVSDKDRTQTIRITTTGNALNCSDGTSGGALVDSYSETNQTDDEGLAAGGHTVAGQTFTNTSQCYLNNCVFYLKKHGSPTGYAYARLYTMAGTYGTNGKPTGSPLAVSAPLDVSTLTTSYALTTLYFYGTNRFVMQPNTYYCIALSFSGGGGSDYVSMGYDTVNLTASGNFFSLGIDGKTWIGLNIADICFYVYSGGSGDILRDENNVPVATGVSSDDLKSIIPIYADSSGNLIIKSS